MNAIVWRGLAQCYQGFTLDRITFTLPAGCILGLVGENGAGKSTTQRGLMTATSREDGQVSLLGTDNQSRTSGWCWTRPACPRSSPPWSWVS